MATFSKEQVTTISRYLERKYSEIISNRINQEKEAIKQSDEYKEVKSAVFTVISSIIGEIKPNGAVEEQLNNIISSKYPMLHLSTYDLRREIDVKIDAILCTIEPTSLEEVEKIVESKLDFEKLYLIHIQKELAKTNETSIEEDLF